MNFTFFWFIFFPSDFFSKIRFIYRFSCLENPRSRRMHSIIFDDIFCIATRFYENFKDFRSSVDDKINISCEKPIIILIS